MSSRRANARGSSANVAAAGGAAHRAEATDQIRADVARFFVDLRRTIGADPAIIAHRLKTTPNVLTALEKARVEPLPRWPEVERIVIAYAAWAGVDGRPVMAALGILMREAEQRRHMARQAAAVRPAVNASSERLAQMLAIAESARRLPREALNKARAKPVQTFYTLSLPLGILIVLMNSNAVTGAMPNIPKPLKRVGASIQDMLAVTFAPTREGLRWIDVSDPRRRRSDKLDTTGEP